MTEGPAIRDGGVVVGSDGTETGLGAIRFGVYEAAIRSVRCDVVSSAEPDAPDRVLVAADLMEGADGYSSEHSQLTHGRYAGAAFAAARDLGSAVPVTVEQSVGAVVDDLIERGRTASMVVISTRATGLGELLGSPGFARITATGCPVAVVPEDWAPGTVHRRIAAAVDGSTASARAADFAAREAEYRGVPLELFHAWSHDDLIDMFEGRRQGLLTVLHDVERHTAARVAADTGNRHTSATIAATELRGTIAAVLPAVAERVDALVLGRWRPGVPAWASALASTRLVTDLRCPLIIVA